MELQRAILQFTIRLGTLQRRGIIWRAVRLALRSKNYPIQKWESVLTDVLHSLRSLLSTMTNATPHELFFNFNRRFVSGKSLPTWLTELGPVLLRNLVRTNKNDDIVREVDLVSANPTYAHVRFPDGREFSVSLRDLAPLPEPNVTPSDLHGQSFNDSFNSDSSVSSNVYDRVVGNSTGVDNSTICDNADRDRIAYSEDATPISLRRSS